MWQDPYTLSTVSELPFSVICKTDFSFSLYYSLTTRYVGTWNYNVWERESEGEKEIWLSYTLFSRLCVSPFRDVFTVSVLSTLLVYYIRSIGFWVLVLMEGESRLSAVRTSNIRDNGQSPMTLPMRDIDARGVWVGLIKRRRFLAKKLGYSVKDWEGLFSRVELCVGWDIWVSCSEGLHLGARWKIGGVAK